MVQKRMHEQQPSTQLFDLSTVPTRESTRLNDQIYLMMDHIRFLLQERKVPSDNVREVFAFLARINEEQMRNPPNTGRLHGLFDEGQRIISSFGESPREYHIETFCHNLVTEAEMRDGAQNQISELGTFSLVIEYFDSPESRRELRYARLLSELLQNEISRETPRLVYLEVLIDEAHRSNARMEQIVMNTVTTESNSSVREK